MLNKKNKLYDTSIFTKEENVWSVYSLCITVRVVIGICAILGLINNKAILTLAIIIAYTFGNLLKQKGQTNWKSYWKPIINYSTIAILNSYSIYKCRKDEKDCNNLLSMISSISGGIIIADAVAGLESRILVDKLSS